MDKLPLLHQKHDGTYETQWVPIQDILLMKAGKYGYTVHAKVDNSMNLRTFHILEDWLVLLQPYGFERTDVGNIINLNEAKHYKNKEVYFDDNISPNNPVIGTVSRPNYERLKKFFNSIKRG